MTAVPDVSVVIPTHNRAGRLAAQLASLREQTLAPDRFEVIVVDDGSTDATPEVLATAAAAGGPAVRHLRHEAPQGPARARNAGWRAARGRLIAFTDDDCVSTPGWLAAALAVWDGGAEVLIQGRTGPIPAEVPQLGPWAYTIEIDDVTPETETCNIFYPRAVLERLGGFDEGFPGPQGEDTDLGWRARGIGVRPVFAPEARVHHAVMVLGPAGLLRRAWRWTPTVLPFARYPELRRERLIMGVFWNWTHYLVARSVIALPLTRRRWGWPVAWWLSRRLFEYELQKARGYGGSIPLAGFWLVHDVVETAAVVRGAVRYRTAII